MRKDLIRCLPKTQSRTIKGIAILLAFVEIHCHTIDGEQGNGAFAAEQSRGTKSPDWRSNDSLGHVEQRKFKFSVLVQHIRVRHLLSSLTILYHVIAQLQNAHYRPGAGRSV